jgi:hypothetical protein
MAANGAAAQGFEDRIHALEPIIGHYPAAIKDAQAARDLKIQYEALKRDLDTAVAAHPEDERLLAQRGVLQGMGHNFDYSGAWDGATRDLSAALKKNPEDMQAILALANLWVNSRPDLAGKAEQLYLGAQCLKGVEPLEEAQRGLFFALYYQGRIKDAFLQAHYMKKTWPDNRAYAQLVDVSLAGLKKNGGKPPQVPASPVMLACDNPAH